MSTFTAQEQQLTKLYQKGLTMNFTLKTSLAALAFSSIAILLLTPMYAQAEYVKCNSQTTGSVKGNIEYISAECTRSDGTTYLQSQVHLDLMSAGANRPSKDPVIAGESLADKIARLEANVVKGEVYRERLNEQLPRLNVNKSRYTAEITKRQNKGKPTAIIAAKLAKTNASNAKVTGKLAEVNAYIADMKSKM